MLFTKYFCQVIIQYKETLNRHSEAVLSGNYKNEDIFCDITGKFGR